MKRTLLFAVIASVLTTGAFAISSTVTSKEYVDAQDALKQNTIPAAGTNASTPGDTVVTYTQTGNGTIGERGIYAGGDYDENADANKLVTADVAYRSGACVAASISSVSCYEYDSNTNECLLVSVGEPSGVCDDPWSDAVVIPATPPSNGIDTCASYGVSCTVVSGGSSCCSGLTCVNGICQEPQGEQKP